MFADKKREHLNSKKNWKIQISRMQTTKPSHFLISVNKINPVFFPFLQILARDIIGGLFHSSLQGENA